MSHNYSFKIIFDNIVMEDIHKESEGTVKRLIQN